MWAAGEAIYGAFDRYSLLLVRLVSSKLASSRRPERNQEVVEGEHGGVTSEQGRAVGKQKGGIGSIEGAQWSSKGANRRNRP